MDMEIYSVENVSPFNIYFSAKPVQTAPNSKTVNRMKSFYGWALVDSGASFCFIHPDIVRKYHIPTKEKKHPKKIKVIDGHDINSGLVTHKCTLTIELGSHKEQLSCNVADIGKHSIVLGMSWLKIHNPVIDWATKHISFLSSLCTNNCIIPSSNLVYANVGGDPDPFEADLGGVEVFQPLEGVPRSPGGVEARKPLEGIPEEFRNFADVFSEDKVTELPLHRPYDLEIVLKDENTSVKGPVYPLRASDDEELRRILKENWIWDSFAPQNPVTVLW
jgi:hypothetical protein